MRDTLLKPSPLKAGDTVAIVSPAAPTAEAGDFGRGRKLLEEAGYRVRLMPNAQAKNIYLAGTDEQRLSDLHEAFRDPDVKAILCARGGYGAMRLLPHLDYELVRRNPKVFIGFSDITALHLAFYQRAGLIGFYGPMLTSNLINNEPFSQAHLLQLVSGQHDVPYDIPNADTYLCFRPGAAEGTLIGGNLSLLTSLCGTPYQPDTRGAILFVEDWKEQYYTLDRQFQQLRLAGMLDNLAGLLLCDFSQIAPEEGMTLPELLKSLVGDLDVPSGFGFSVGHGEQTATLPIGVKARFDASHGNLCILESPVA